MASVFVGNACDIVEFFLPLLVEQGEALKA